jgi:hypothetical protein
MVVITRYICRKRIVANCGVIYRDCIVTYSDIAISDYFASTNYNIAIPVGDCILDIKRVCYRCDVPSAYGTVWGTMGDALLFKPPVQTFLVECVVTGCRMKDTVFLTDRAWIHTLFRIDYFLNGI